MRYLYFLMLGLSTCLSYAQSGNETITRILINFEKQNLINQFVYSSELENKQIKDFILNDSLFELTTKPLINTGFQSRYNWIKCDLINQSNNTEFIFEFNQTYIDSLSFFVVQDGKVIKSFPKKGLYFTQNNDQSFLQNKYAYIYLITLPKDKATSIYINGIVNDGSFKVLNTLWTASNYKERIKEIKIKTAYILSFTGFVNLIILLSVTMFFFSKKWLYLYYAGFVFVIFFNLISLRHFISPLFAEKYLFLGNNFSEMFGLLQIIFIVQYANHLLNIKNEYPKLFSTLKIIVYTTSAIFFLALFMRKLEWFKYFIFYFSKFEMIFITFLLYGISIFLMFKKRIMAFYFSIAYFPLVLFVTHYILTAFKLTNTYSPLQWEFVIFFEISVLSIAMAHNYYLLIKENIIYQNKIYTQRLKISRDLHDNIGSQLTFIISSIDNLKFLTDSTNKKLHTKLSEINEFAGVTISQLRDTIWAMNKNEITFEDLQSRILNLIEKAKLATNNSIQFNFDSNIKSTLIFSSLKGINIFRVLQEAINNSIKYANANEINVSITETNNELELIVTDNGIGFDIKNIELGNGLENMQNRMNKIGGEIIINSKIGNGTSIKLKCIKNKTNAV